MQSYPFTSQVTYDEEGLPLYDRAIDSEFLRAVFARYFADGVFYDPTDALQVTAGTGMTVQVAPGACHIRGAIGIEDAARTLTVQASGAQDRIDTVVARLDLSLAARSIDLYILPGTPAETPSAPALTRDATVWELGLANLFIAKNSSAITQQRITDTRLDTARCGVVAQTIGALDTAPYFAQLSAAIAAHGTAAQKQLDDLAADITSIEQGSAVMLRQVYDPAGAGVDVTVQTYVHSYDAGTHTHNLEGQGRFGAAKLTAPYLHGNGWTVNGVAYAALASGTGETAEEMASDAWVTFVVDEAQKQINFKLGGGLSSSKLAAATAGAGDVRQGQTFYAGDKTLKTGTLALSGTAASANVVAGKTFYSTDPRTKNTGTLPDYGHEPQAKSVGTYQNGLYLYLQNADTSTESVGGRVVRSIYATFASVASAIGLTAAKLVSGNTILGVSGSDRGYSAGYSEGNSAGYNSGYNAGYSAGVGACYINRTSRWVSEVSSDAELKARPFTVEVNTKGTGQPTIILHFNNGTNVTL